MYNLACWKMHNPSMERLRQCCLEFKVSCNLGYKVKQALLINQKINRQLSKVYV